MVTNASKIFTILRGQYDSDSVFASNDSGIHWNPSFTGLPKLPGFSFSPTSLAASGAKIFIGTPSGIFSSKNSGQAWAKLDDIFVEDGSDHVISLASTNTGIIAFVDSILYLSKDNGSTWISKKVNNIPETLMAAHVSASGTNIILEGNKPGEKSFLLFSADIGESWADIGKNIDESEYPGIVSTSFISGKSIFMNTQYGMFTSKDKGATWLSGAKGLPAHFTGNTMVANGSIIFYGGYQGVFLSINEGESWVEVNNKKLRNGVSSLAIIGSNIFALTKENEIYKASVNELVASIAMSKN